MNDQPDPNDRNGPKEPFLFRIVRAAIAPDVLDDGGTDAPLSRRGRIIFWSVVTVLVVGIAVLLVVSGSRQ